MILKYTSLIDASQKQTKISRETKVLLEGYQSGSFSHFSGAIWV